MMDRKYQVFISSTYADLRKERQKAILFLLKMGCIPIGMELIPALNKNTWSVIKESIDSSDVYIVIIGSKYGSYCPVELSQEIIHIPHKISFTELEYRYAKSTGKEVLVFMMRDIENINDIKKESETEKKVKLGEFRNELSQQWCAYWQNSNELVYEMNVALSNYFVKNRDIGFIRPDDDYYSSEKLLKKVKTAGITDLFFGRQEMQANKYNIEDLLDSLDANDSIYVFARSARAFGDQYKMIDEIIQEKGVYFTFALGDPNIDTYDTWGKADLLHVLSLFEVGITNKSHFVVYSLPFYITFSFVLIEKRKARMGIIDLFVDLPYEKRHTIILKDNNENTCFLNAFFEMKDDYLKIARRIDFTSTSYNSITKIFNK